MHTHTLTHSLTHTHTHTHTHTRSLSLLPPPAPPLLVYRDQLLPKTVSFKRDMYSSLKELVVPVMEKHLLDIGEVWI
jgi:hypothetical protein